MSRVITKAVKAAATKEYVHNNKTIRDVASMYGMNSETLRKILGNKVRPRGTRYLADGSIKVPRTINGGKSRKSTTSVATPNSNQRWTATEDEMLRDAVLSKMTVRETVELLGRSSAAIYCRKCQLIDEGFIKDPETRFVLPSGITRVRKPMSHALESTEVIEEIVEEVKAPVVATESNSASVSNNIELAQLAQIVKDYGVNVTVNVSSSGTEVKMSK